MVFWEKEHGQLEELEIGGGKGIISSYVSWGEQYLLGLYITSCSSKENKTSVCPVIKDYKSMVSCHSFLRAFLKLLFNSKMS